jgi:hypothetical protein
MLLPDARMQPLRRSGSRRGARCVHSCAAVCASAAGNGSNRNLSERAISISKVAGNQNLATQKCEKWQNFPTSFARSDWFYGCPQLPKPFITRRRTLSSSAHDLTMGGKAGSLREYTPRSLSPLPLWLVGTRANSKRKKEKRVFFLVARAFTCLTFEPPRLVHVATRDFPFVYYCRRVYVVTIFVAARKWLSYSTSLTA